MALEFEHDLVLPMLLELEQFVNEFGRFYDKVDSDHDEINLWVYTNELNELLNRLNQIQTKYSIYLDTFNKEQ